MKHIYLVLYVLFTIVPVFYYDYLNLWKEEFNSPIVLLLVCVQVIWILHGIQNGMKETKKLKAEIFAPTGLWMIAVPFISTLTIPSSLLATLPFLTSALFLLRWTLLLFNEKDEN